MRIILIHGVGLCAQAWGAVQAALGPDYAALAIDLPAHGTSRAAPMRTLDNAVVPLMHLLDEAPAFVVGHSLGALITLRLLTKAHPKLLGAALLNPVYARDIKAKKTVQARAQALAAGQNDPETTLDRWYQDQYPVARAQTRTWLLASQEGYQAAYKVFAFYEDEALASLQSIAPPVLALTGAKDPNSTPAMALNLAQKLPNARAIIIENSGHMALMTHPHTVASALQGFIERVWKPVKTKPKAL